MEYPKFKKCTDQPSVPITTTDRTTTDRTATGLMMFTSTGLDYRDPILKSEYESKQIIRIATHIHYPECWDTAAYPTLADAVCEITCCDPAQCTHKKMGIGE